MSFLGDFDYENPTYIPLTQFSAHVVGWKGDGRSGQLKLDLRVEPDCITEALMVRDYPGQSFRVTIERIDFPEVGLVVQEGVADTTGEWGSVEASKTRNKVEGWG